MLFLIWQAFTAKLGIVPPPPSSEEKKMAGVTGRMRPIVHTQCDWLIKECKWMENKNGYPP